MIMKFLQNGSIPSEISKSRARRNFKRTAASFFLDTEKLYKVNSRFQYLLH